MGKVGGLKRLIASWLRILSAIAEDWGLVHSTHIRRLTNVRNSSSMNSNIYILTNMHMCAYENKYQNLQQSNKRNNKN